MGCCQWSPQLQPAYFHLTGCAASYRHTLRANVTSALLKSNFKKAA